MRLPQYLRVRNRMYSPNDGRRNSTELDRLGERAAYQSVQRPRRELRVGTIL